MEIKNNMVKTDEPTSEIHVFMEGERLLISKVKQDKLGRVYITVRKLSSW